MQNNQFQDPGGWELRSLFEASHDRRSDGSSTPVSSIHLQSGEGVGRWIFGSTIMPSPSRRRSASDTGVVAPVRSAISIHASLVGHVRVVRHVVLFWGHTTSAGRLLFSPGLGPAAGSPLLSGRVAAKPGVGCAPVRQVRLSCPAGACCRTPGACFPALVGVGSVVWPRNLLT